MQSAAAWASASLAILTGLPPSIDCSYGHTVNNLDRKEKHQRLSPDANLYFSQQLSIFIDEICDFSEESSPLLRRRQSPALVRYLRGSYSFVHICRLATCYGAYFFLGVRIDRLKDGAVLGRLELPVNEEARWLIVGGAIWQTKSLCLFDAHVGVFSSQ